MHNEIWCLNVKRLPTNVQAYLLLLNLLDSQHEVSQEAVRELIVSQINYLAAHASQQNTEIVPLWVECLNLFDGAAFKQSLKVSPGVIVPQSFSLN